MANVKASSGRVGEHLKDVIFLPSGLMVDLVGLFFFPELLPFLLDDFKIVFVVTLHDQFYAFVNEDVWRIS